MVLSTHNSVFSTRVLRLYGFLASPVVSCMQNSDFRTKSLWVPDPTYGFSMQNSEFLTGITSLYGSQTWPVVFCMYSVWAWLAPELLVSIGLRPGLWFLIAKQRLFVQNYNSLWVPDLTCRFVHAKRRVFTRMTSLYGLKPSTVVLCMQNSDFRTRLTSLYGSQTSAVVMSTQKSVLSTRIKRQCWFQPSPVALCM